MALDTTKWLADLGFAEAEIAELAPKFAPKATEIEKGQMRLSDFSRKQDELRKTQDDLGTKADRLDSELAEWATLSAAERETNTKLRADIEASEQKVLALQQRVTRIATDAGLDPQKALEGIDQAPPKKEPVTPPIDTSKFVSADAYGSMSNFLMDLAIEVPLLAQEHFELTGERLDTRAIRTEIIERAKVKNAVLDPRAIWEEKYGIQEKRATKTAEARTAELAAAEQRGFERARTEAALPTAPSQGLHSPVLKGLDGGKQRESVLKRPVPEQGVRSAAAALATGKYREKTA